MEARTVVGRGEKSLPRGPGSEFNPFSTAVSIGGQTILIPSDLSPKRDWGRERVKTENKGEDK